MLELTGVASILHGISIFYWLLAIGALALVLWKVQRWWGKVIGAVIVLAVFGYAQNGFDFIEQSIEKGGDRVFQRIYPLQQPPFIAKSLIAKPDSRFGISWEDISTQKDRKYWVAGSRLRILDLSNNSIVAERIGYFIEAGFGSTAGQRRPWQTSKGPSTTCPAITNRDHSDRWFVLKVINSSEGGTNGK